MNDNLPLWVGNNVVYNGIALNIFFQKFNLKIPFKEDDILGRNHHISYIS